MTDDGKVKKIGAVLWIKTSGGSRPNEPTSIPLTKARQGPGLAPKYKERSRPERASGVLKVVRNQPNRRPPDSFAFTASGHATSCPAEKSGATAAFVSEKTATHPESIEITGDAARAMEKDARARQVHKALFMI
jgi:hypothetical protein